MRVEVRGSARGALPSERAVPGARADARRVRFAAQSQQVGGVGAAGGGQCKSGRERRPLGLRQGRHSLQNLYKGVQPHSQKGKFSKVAL